MRDRNRRNAAQLLLSVLLFAGCAGYEGAVGEMRGSLLDGDKQRALELVGKALEEDDPDAFPDNLKGDKALLLLERAMIKQGLSSYKSSASDFRTADKHLELLDLQNDTMGNIGKFIFSDDATVYQAPAYEKLLVNTFNMVNYLSIGDYEGARVEARRLRVMQKYLAGEESEQAALLSLGSYLSGFAFEASGQHEQALSFYVDAIREHSYKTIAEPVRRLASCTGSNDETLSDYIKRHGGPFPECVPPPKNKGTLLVVSGVGLAPYKRAERIPIGMAVSIAAAYIDPNDPNMQRVMARGLLTWVNFPVLERSPVRYANIRCKVNGTEIPTELGDNLTDKVIAAWDSIKGKLMGAAIVRMVTRLVAGIATEKAVSEASGSAIGGLLAGLAVQGTMTAFDTPDTRSWVTLPHAVYLSRAELAPGKHRISVLFEGQGSGYAVEKEVEIKAGGFTVVSTSSMR
jgi:uncharacterized protein